MSVASEITRIQNNISSAYTALDGKGATLPQIQNSANLANTIESIPTGSGGVTTNPALKLIDWEGTVLQEYSKSEALALEALPAPSTLTAYSNVDHELLVFQEWNWSLADIKTWLTNHAQGKLNVGAIYTTTDGQDHNYWASPRGENVPFINRQKRGTVSIGDHSFEGYPSLTSINIPDGVTSIGNEAFQSCSCLTSVNIPNSVTSIESSAFSHCYSLTSINIPDGVTKIKYGAFGNCYSLKSVNIPDSITSIGDYAFQNCFSLTSINIPDGVTSIGEQAFLYCYSLASINIPDSVTSIGGYAFLDCANLFDILLEGKPAFPDFNILAGVPSTVKIYVPRENLSWFEAITDGTDLYSIFVAIEDNIEYLESIGFNVDAYKEAA